MVETILASFDKFLPLRFDIPTPSGACGSADALCTEHEYPTPPSGRRPLRRRPAKARQGRRGACPRAPRRADRYICNTLFTVNRKNHARMAKFLVRSVVDH